MGIQAKRLGIFTATRWELNAVRRVMSVREERLVSGVRCVVGHHHGASIFLYQTGVGMQRATDVCQKVFPTEPLDLAIASGFACALTSARVGDLLIGTDVISKMDAVEGRTREEAYPCSAEAALAAAQVARTEGLIVQSGRFITVPRVLWRADEKRAMAAVSGAIGADMESAAICAEAANREVPALVIRTVSDVLEEDLPLDFNLFLDRSCWTQGVLSCLTHPSTLVGLNRMRVQAGRSAEVLSGFFGKFLDELD